MSINRRDFLKNTALAGAALRSGNAWSKVPDVQNSRLNVVFIVADDLRPDGPHVLGNNEIQTPNIDRLAARGSVFHRATCSYPICFVSRTEMVTGRCLVGAGAPPYSSCGLYGDIPIDSSWTLWPELVQRSGWVTIFSGKWNVPGSPWKSGYSATAGLYSSGGGGPKDVRATVPAGAITGRCATYIGTNGPWGKPWATIPVDANGRRVTGYTDWTFKTDKDQPLPDLGVGLTPDTDIHIADQAIDAIRQNVSQPFFIQVNFTSPHDPRIWPRGMENRIDYRALTLPSNFRPQHPFTTGDLDGRDEVLIPAPRSSESVKKERAVYFTCVENVDRQVGRIVRTLEETGELSRTLIIFTADHGLAIGSHGLMGKQNQYEHTINVPLILAGPGIPAGKQIQAQCCLRDLYPTFCELTGLAIPSTVQGSSLMPLLRGERAEIHEAVFGYFRDYQRMVRDANGWKLIWYPAIDRYQLFHLPDDPSELHDLGGEPEQQTRMRKMKIQLEAWQRELKDPMLLVYGRGAAS